MIKAIIFDLNGVLLDDGEYFTVRFAREYNLNEEEVKETFFSIMDILRKPDAPCAYELWKPQLDKWNVKLKKEEFFDYWFLLEKIRPGFLEIIDALQEKDKRVFVLSNNFKERSAHYDKAFEDLFDLVDKTYFSWKTGFVKPEIMAFRNLLEENDLDPEDCIFVDDQEKNVDAANSIGIHSFLFADLDECREKIRVIVGSHEE